MKSPIQIVELRQPRCSLRFGTAPCPATGTPKCYNTFATCPTEATRAVYADTGTIWWRFIANRPGQTGFGSFATDTIKTNGIPVNNLQVSTSRGQLNIGGMLDGKSPFGVRASCSISMDDFAWSDQVGDFYLATRSSLPKRTFWTTFLARVKLFSNIQIVIYDGYEGESLAVMRQRLYILDSIDGPSGGKVTLHGVDPLLLANKSRASFPPAMTMSLMQPLAADDLVLRVTTDDVTNLSNIFGLTTRKFLTIGSEIIEYTGYATVDTGIYDVTGLTRALAGTTAGAGAAQDAVGRAGYFEDALLPDSAEYLLTNFTQIPAALIDSAGWHTERDDWLNLFTSETWITASTPVEDLIGEICQQGTFFLWWDEYAQLVKMSAARPPSGAVPVLDDDTTILADSAVLVRAPESRLTRIFIYYDAKVANGTATDNWSRLTGLVLGDGELSEAGGEPRLVSIYGRWVGSDGQAYMVADRLAHLYADIPRMLSFDVSAKDRQIAVADILDITSRVSVDTEGRAISERWIVTAWSEVIPGQTYHIETQSFPMTGRVCLQMDVTATTYALATTAERLAGGWMSSTTGKMSDGTDGYTMQ